MLKLTPSQLRAARALLNWSRSHLAKLSGISELTLHRFENGQNAPETKTSEKLFRILVAEGIDFLDNQGVRFRPEGVEVLNGEEGMKKFWDMAYTAAQTTNAISRQININDEIYKRCAAPLIDAHMNRMIDLHRLNRKKSLMKVILPVGNFHTHRPEYAEYRWYPKNLPTPIPYYIFGDHVGIFVFDADPPPKIILISSPTIAATYAKQFDEIWNISNVIPKKK